ncbi:MAG: uroporphyrinogen-III synthase [Silicimonas sp.]|nr:uroporphyrinogen-III synthase [Silicimonas sp.]
MVDGGRVLLLTRPEAQSRVFLAECQAHMRRGVSCVISPVMRIVRTRLDVDLSGFRTVIVTSSNAISKELAGKRVATVGEATAERARAVGADARCLGETVSAFLKRIGEIEGPALYLRGVHSRGDLAERARAEGVRVEDVVAYDQVAIALTDAAQNVLQGGRAVVPVFSPRSAALVARYPVADGTRIVAISAAAAEAWTGAGIVTVAARPDRLAMLDAVADAF